MSTGQHNWQMIAAIQKTFPGMWDVWMETSRTWILEAKTQEVEVSKEQGTEQKTLVLAGRKTRKLKVKLVKCTCLIGVINWVMDHCILGGLFDIQYTCSVHTMIISFVFIYLETYFCQKAWYNWFIHEYCQCHDYLPVTSIKATQLMC